MARTIGDPDWRVAASGSWNYTDGVPVGVGVRLPRTPAVLERKLKWRSLDDTEFMGEAANYSSAAEVADELHAMPVEESALGMCEEVEQGAAERRPPQPGGEGPKHVRLCQKKDNHPGDPAPTRPVGPSLPSGEGGNCTRRVMATTRRRTHFNTTVLPRAPHADVSSNATM